MHLMREINYHQCEKSLDLNLETGQENTLFPIALSFSRLPSLYMDFTFPLGEEAQRKDYKTSRGQTQS